MTSGDPQRDDTLVREGAPVHTLELSPFLATLTDEVTRALRAFLDLGDDVAITWRSAAETGALHVEVGGPPGLRIELTGLDTRNARGTAALRIHPPPLDASPAARARFRHVRARVRSDACREPMERLVASVARWSPFHELRDDDYRKVSASADGFYGTLRIGYKCNQSCSFCWQDRHWPAPAPERFFEWLDEMAERGVRSLNITGGEPTTFPLLTELVERAHHVHGMDVSIQTNAIQLSKPEALARLRTAGLAVAMVSYHSADPEVSDAMTLAPGTHAKTVRGIAASLASGIVVTLNCVVETANYETLDRLAEDIVTRFVVPFPNNPVKRVSFAHPTSYREAGLWEKRQVPFDLVRPPLLAAARRLVRAGVPVQIVGTCGFPLCALRDDPELIAAQEVEREMFDTHELEHRRYHDTCASCTRRTRCFGMRQEYLDHFGDRGLVPFVDL